MKPTRSIFIAAAVLALAVLACTSALIVDATEQVVVTQFGKPTAVYRDPGLYWKLPTPIQRVTRFDKRLLYTETDESEVLTADKKNVVVSAYLSWRISDPLTYLAALRTREAAEARLRALVQSELGGALAEIPFSTLVSTDPETSSLTSLASSVEGRSREIAGKDFGIEIADLGITRLNFPSQNLQSVFARMRAERNQIARTFRSEGMAESQKITAEADRERAEILANAQADARKVRGDGEAEAARIYADAYRGHESFYHFLRTLETYEKILNDKTTLILPSDTPLFDLLTSHSAHVRGAAR